MTTVNETSASSAPVCSTGVEGLDEILDGGLPRNRLYLLKGDPGVGKTTLALQFLLSGARAGETGLYITLSETREEMNEVARSHGWTLDPLHLFELTDKEAQLQDGTETTFFHPSDIELNRTTEVLLQEIRRVNPTRIVFDSLSEMRMLADTPLRYRRQILRLKQFFAGRRCTVLLLDDRTSGSEDLQVESIAHGVLLMTLTTPAYGAARRQLHIQKIRGLSFCEGFHDFVIRRGGVIVFPRLVAASHPAALVHEVFPAGIQELDALLGGGLDRGTSTIIMGPPGTGKSSIAAKFAFEAARRGEKALGFLFDESVETLLGRAGQLGMDFAPQIAAGRVAFHRLNPAEISPGEFAHTIRDRVLHQGVRLVLIDSLNGYLNAMPGERHLNLQLHELLSFLGQQGVITIMVLAQQGLVEPTSGSVDLTYLADAVMVLRYFEVRGAVHQAISILKKRSSNHERTIREITVDSGGIRVGAPLVEMRGILMGVPVIEGGAVRPLESESQ